MNNFGSNQSGNYQFQGAQPGLQDRTLDEVQVLEVLCKLFHNVGAGVPNLRLRNGRVDD